MRRASQALLPIWFIVCQFLPPGNGLHGCGTSHAEERQLEAARITATEPAVIVRGAKVPLKIRGFKLKEGTELRFSSAHQAKVEITEQKDAAQPKGLENKVVGDTQLLAEIDLPEDHPAGVLEFVIVTPSGNAAGKILVLAADAVIDEIEPNNGFHESQKLPSGMSVRGSIQGDKDVDVYAFAIAAGEQWRVTITAGGPSILDAELNGYNARGQLLAASDDAETRDPVLLLKSSVDDVVFLCVGSVHDIGGEWHSYLLTVEEVK